MSISNAPTPPLLLTKRLNAFLHAHHSSQLPTLLLTTSHGKILAHASSQPVSLLRTHATVAASLLAIHTSSSVAIPTALPGSRTPPDLIPRSPAGSDEEEEEEEEDEEEEGEEGIDDDARSQNSGYSGTQRRRDSERQEYYYSPRARNEHRGQSGKRAGQQEARNAIQPGTITVQLTGGTVVIRRLDCGLLFVCVGPPATADLYANEPSSSSDSNPHHQHRHQNHQQQQQHHHHHHQHHSSPAIGSPSEADSLISTGGQTSTSSIESSNAGPVVAMRKRAAELARRLDEKLGTLKVPGEGIGIE